MKIALVCLLSAVFASSLLVNITLWWEVGQSDAAEANCRKHFGVAYELALEQNNALNACIGELEMAQECRPRLEKCMGVK